jgi:hypothetical protein
VAPLSEHERNILLDLEMSLLADTKGPADLSVRSEYENARRRALWGSFIFVMGIIVMTVFLTLSLAASLTGLFFAIGSSLVCAHQSQRAWRASRMLKSPSSN